MEMSESPCEISEPTFNMTYSCANTCLNNTCITGSVRWVGKIGTAIRSSTLGDLNLSDDKDLIKILGSTVRWEPRPTVRVYQESPPKLSIPDRAEVVKDEKGSIVGWILLDTGSRILTEDPVFCAAIRGWRKTTPPDPILGLVQGFDYMGEECMDVMVLVERDEKPGTYKWVGLVGSWTRVGYNVAR
jgi:hypothetical protein